MPNTVDYIMESIVCDFSPDQWASRRPPET